MKVENQFLKKSIATQTGGFEYLISLAVNNTTGHVNFGFSGDNKVLDFDIRSGRILDYQDNFVYGISPNEVVALSGRCLEAQHNFYINDAPVNLNSVKENETVDWFYINTENCRVDIDLYIKGERPFYDISNLVFTGQNRTGYGTIENISGFGKKFKVFSGDFYNNDYKFVSFPTGNITGIDQYVAIKNISGVVSATTGETTPNIGFRLYTNFGVINDRFDISTVNLFVQTLDLEGPTYIRETGTITLFLNYANLLGGVPVDGSTGFPLNIAFRNISGDGLSGYGYASGSYTGNPLVVSSNNIISGTGVLSYYFDSLLATGLDVDNNLRTGLISGAISGDTLYFATGNFSDYIVKVPLGTGLGYGYYSGIISGTGDSSIYTMSGYINGSGYLYGDSGHSSSFASGLRNSDLLYGQINNSGLLQSFEFFTGYISGEIYVLCTGMATGKSTTETFASGRISGYNEVDILNNGSLILTGEYSGLLEYNWGTGLDSNYYYANTTVYDEKTIYYTGYSESIVNTLSKSYYVGDPPIYQGLLHSYDVTGSLTDGPYILTIANPYVKHSGKKIGTGLFQGTFLGITSGFSTPKFEYGSGIIRNILMTGEWTDWTGYYTGYYASPVSGYLTGYMTGHGYSGLGFTYSTGYVTGNVFEHDMTGMNYPFYSHPASGMFRLSGYGSSTGNPIRISGNTGFAITCNLDIQDITGNFPPSFNVSFNRSPVWFHYTALGGPSTASVTFEVDEYVIFSGNLKNVHPLYKWDYDSELYKKMNTDQTHVAPYMAIYYTGLNGELIFVRSDTINGPGNNPREYATSLSAGTGFYVCVSLSDQTDYPGFFKLRWRDGWRDASYSSTYLMDNVEKTINHFIEDRSISGAVSIGDFSGRAFRVMATGELPELLIKPRHPVFSYYSGGPTQYEEGLALASVFCDIPVSGFFESTDIGVKYIYDYSTGAVTSHLKVLDRPKTYTGVQFLSYNYQSNFSDYYGNQTYFLARTGNVDNDEHSQKTDAILIAGPWTVGTDFFTVQQYTDLVNGEMNRYNLYAYNDGTNIMFSGFNINNADLVIIRPNGGSYTFTSPTKKIIEYESYNPSYSLNSGYSLETEFEGTGRVGIYEDYNFIGTATGVTGHTLAEGISIFGVSGYIYEGSGILNISNGIQALIAPSNVTGISGYEGDLAPIGLFTGNIVDIVFIGSGYIEKTKEGQIIGPMLFPTGFITSTGEFYTYKNFIVYDGSGFFNFDSILETGYATNSFYTEDILGIDIPTQPSGIFSGINNQNYAVTGIRQDIISGDATGAFRYGFLKTFTGEWNIITGLSSTSPQVNFYNESFYEPLITGYTNINQNFRVAGTDSIRILIERKKNIGFDIHQLEISGFETGIIYQISGGK